MPPLSNILIKLKLNKAKIKKTQYAFWIQLLIHLSFHIEWIVFVMDQEVSVKLRKCIRLNNSDWVRTRKIEIKYNILNFTENLLFYILQDQDVVLSTIFVFIYQSVQRKIKTYVKILSAIEFILYEFRVEGVTMENKYKSTKKY